MQQIKTKECQILHLISSSGLLGAERVLLELAKNSKEAGLKVTIGVFENNQNPNLELANYAKEAGFEVKSFPCDGRLDQKAVQMIKDYVDDNGIQILHSHNYKSNFYAWRALQGTKVHWVVTNHGRRLGTKLSLYNLLDLFIIRKADWVVAVSNKIARRMERAGIKRVCIIENGINLIRYSEQGESNGLRESLGIKEDAFVVGTVGSLTIEKGHHYLLKAIPDVVRRFPEARFLIVGDGNKRPDLERMASEMGIRGQVIFTGMRKDIPEILSALDLFVLPSLIEGLPIALLEAQAARVPAVATRVGAIPDVVEDGVTGILIPRKEPGPIAKAIFRILSDRDFASGIAQKGFERVRDHFSSNKMAAQYISLYRELIS